MRVSDVFDLQMGKTPSRKEPAYWNNGDYEWVSIKDLGTCGKYVGSTRETISELGRRESGIKPVPASTLIMSFKLSLGKTAITTRETYTNEAIMAFVDKGRYPFSLDYMWHQFRSKDWTAGTNMAVMGKTLNKKTLGAATIAVPPIEEQISIARRLDYLQELTGQSECWLALLDTLVKSRFVEMFGKCAVRVPLGKVCSFKSGKTLPKDKEMPSGDFLYAKVGDLNLPGNETTIRLSRTYVDAATAKSCLIPKGAVIFPKRGGAIGTNKKRVTGEDCCMDLNLMSVIPGREVCTEYLLGWFEQMDLADIANGSTVPQINNKDLDPLIIPLPKMELQQEFASFVAQVDKSRFIAQQQIEKLQMLYDSLAQEYFA